MGRRRKRSRSSDDEDDSLEREYMIRRQKILKNNADNTSKESSTFQEKEVSEKTNKSTDSTPCNDKQQTGQKKKKSPPEQASLSPTDAKESDKIERMRLKKRRKKELQKEKKKAAAQKQAKEEETITKQNKAKEEERKKKELKNGESRNSNRFLNTHRGVQYCDIVVGKGPVVQDRKKVRVSYKLRAKHKTGKILDSSSNFGFRMGKGEVIPGWEIGLLRMRQGGTRHLIIPPNAGYGNKNIGAGAGALLYFEVTLLSC
eukprot:CAMPEP_0203662622 /NCGR_PEP_ID=MMETSP0090-20130426/526_1 /ASSEMBLY_ACC=CAM_ASM_001088 /TAXON_ID=426623 /ORGANISM="Chaetoceros affinis, Strain CCMP159" /LENGTH=258 /DNA_ID=CAMNT_0050525437 /DNA_START=13 /DNA_END=789 /DNA_ORIENTATION=+